MVARINLVTLTLTETARDAIVDCLDHALRTRYGADYLASVKTLRAKIAGVPVLKSRKVQRGRHRFEPWP